MILWNIISIVLVVLTLREAAKNGWRFPRFNSFATITFMWFIASTLMALGVV